MDTKLLKALYIIAKIAKPGKVAIQCLDMGEDVGNKIPNSVKERKLYKTCLKNENKSGGAASLGSCNGRYTSDDGYILTDKCKGCPYCEDIRGRMRNGGH
jgi:hypothetical protein